jgi:quinol monooxygenase YgiN
MSPLIVRPVDGSDGEYAIIAGSRRYRAAVEVGKDTVPCTIVEADDFEAAVMSLKENKERKDLTDDERMRSLRMQYELIKPVGGPPWQCPNDDCDSEFEDDKRLHQHVGNMNTDCSLDRGGSPKFGQDSERAHTPTQAYDILADIHYPDMIDTWKARSHVKSQVKAVELPDVLQALLKSKDERTVSEQEQLKKRGIDTERVMTSEAGSTGLSEAFSSIVDLHDELKDVDGIDADRRAVEAVGRLDVDQDDTDLKHEIDRVRQEFTESVSDSTSEDSTRKQFEELIQQREAELVELSEELDSDAFGSYLIHFDSQKYRRYHAQAKTILSTESDAEVVETGYKKYLDDLIEDDDD